MSKRTVLLIFIFLFSFSVLILLLGNSIGKITPARIPRISNLAPTPILPARTAQLSLAPNPLTISSPSGSIQITLSPRGAKVSLISMILRYDPKVISQMKITLDPKFKKALVFFNKVDQQKGELRFTVGIDGRKIANYPQFTLATLSFTANMTPNMMTQISFAPATNILPFNGSSNVLKQAMGANIIYIPK